MSESLVIKDGLGQVKSLQVDSGSYGYVPHHTLTSTVTTSSVELFYNGSGWSFDNVNNQITTIATADTTRKGIIVHNNSESGKCYLLFCGANDNFGAITDASGPPPKYSIFLDAGATYFGDHTTAALKHMIYVSDNYNGDQAYMSVAVTKVY